MSAGTAFGRAHYLDAYLAPFAPLLARNDVTDIYVNRPGELWTETLGGRIDRHEIEGLDNRSLERLARQVASFSHQGVSRAHPLLSARLPGGERIQIVLPPATRGSVALAIRKYAKSDLRIDDYVVAGSVASGDRSSVRLRGDLKRSLSDAGIASCLRLAVLKRANIVVSGGTSTGKTTFLNTLIAEISDIERLVLIEDTAELSMPHPNGVGLLAVRGRLGEADVSANDLVTASLRLRPDRIILGELRGDEALAFLRAVNSGHPGSMTTIHADSPSSAVAQLTLLCHQAGSRLGSNQIAQIVADSIDLFVQLDRKDGGRVISQIEIAS